MYITARNTKVLQQASVLADNPRSTQISIHFHTNARVLIPDVTCDVRNRNMLIPIHQAEYHQITDANLHF